jgi:hypothetical protein
MNDRVLLFSGFYGVRLPDGRRLLEPAPVGQIVEGPNPGPFGLSIGNTSVFRVLNLGDGRYVLQYGPNQIPIILNYQNELDGAAIESFEAPMVTETGIMPVGMNQGAYATLFPPTAAQPITALPGYAAPPSQQSIVEQAVRDRAAQEARNRANAAAGIQQDFTPRELMQPTTPAAPNATPTPQIAQQQQPRAAQPTSDVYYMQSAQGGAVVDTTRRGDAEMPAGVSPIAVAGAMVLLFLLGDEGN